MKTKQLFTLKKHKGINLITVECTGISNCEKWSSLKKQKKQQKNAGHVKQAMQQKNASGKQTRKK